MKNLMKSILIAFCVLLSASLLFAGGMAAIASADDGSNLVAKTAAPKMPLAGCQGYAVVPIGNEISAGAYSARLADISTATGATNTHLAIVDILDQNGAVIDKVQIAPGESYVFSGAAGNARISICQIAPGITMNAKWAKMRIGMVTAQPSNPCAGYSTLDIGSAMAVGGIASVKLSDIGIATGQNNVHTAIIDVLDSNDAVVAQKQLAPGESKVVQVGNQNIRIYACQTAPGMNMNAKWAKIKAVPITSDPATEECAKVPFAVTKRGIISIGGILDNGQYKVRLADISVENDASKKHAAIVDILDANEAVLDSAVIDPGTAYTYTDASGLPLNIYNCQTAPGFTLNAKWADLRLGS